MFLVELVPLGRNLFVEFFAKLRVFGLLGVVSTNIHRIFSPLTVVIKVATKISGNEQLAM